jgi:hypothetical protein
MERVNQSIVNKQEFEAEKAAWSKSLFEMIDEQIREQASGGNPFSSVMEIRFHENLKRLCRAQSKYIEYLEKQNAGLV